MTLQDQVELAKKLRWDLSAQSLRYFLSSVTIASSPAPARFGEIAEPWQHELIEPKIPAIEHLAGKNPGYSGPLQFMSILARGHDKSSLEGRLATYLLLFSNVQIKGYIFASDADQGQLILQAMEDEAQLTPRYRDQLKFRRDHVLGPSGFIEVLPADSGSAFGLRGNLFVADEFTHWKNDRLWRAVYTGTEKVNPSLVIVLSNAGILDTWQHNIFLEAQSSPAWRVFYREGQLASWMSREKIEEKSKLLPPFERDRLFNNKWIDPAAEADYLRTEEIMLCIELSKHLNLAPRFVASHAVNNYIGSVDYGPRRDRTALCILHQDGEKRVVVDRLDVWQGSPEAPTSIDRVEKWILQQNEKFRPALWVIDPYQMEGSIQDMERRGIPVERFDPRGGAGNYALAQLLRRLIVEGRLVWYPAAGNLSLPDGKTETLMDELRHLRVKKMPYGFRFDHENQKHDDRAVAIAMAALRAEEFPLQPRVLELPKLPGSFGRRI